MENPPTQQMQNAAERVQRRITYVELLKGIVHSGPFVLLLGLILSMLLRWTGTFEPGLLHAAAYVGVWLTGCMGRAWLLRPSPVEALARWDERADRHDSFVSAYWFETHQPCDRGEQMHLETARETLPEEQEKLSDHFPVPHVRRELLLMLLLGIFSSSNLMIWESTNKRKTLNNEQQNQLQKVAKDLSDDVDQLSEPEALDEDEKEAFEEVKEEIEQTDEEFNDPSDKTRREVLEKLEEKARKAEKLAKSLSENQMNDLSSDMLSELERHADTAELGEALRSGKAGKAAEEAKEIAKKLDGDKMSIREKNRLKNALGKALDAASSSDRKSPVGQRLSSAHKKLEDGNQKQAGKEFEKMSRRLARLQGRQKTRRKMKRIARKLREAGREATKKNQYANQQGIRKLSGNKNGQNKNGQNDRKMARLGRMFPGGSGSQNAGSSAGQQQGGQGAVGTPKQGQQGGAPVPGSGSSKKGKGNGSSAPVPGTGQGNQSGGQAGGSGTGNTPGGGTGSGAGQSSGSAPSSGAGSGSGTGSAGQQAASGSGTGKGGLQAGSGTAPYNPKKTQAHEGSETHEVTPDSNSEGPSTIRQKSGTPQNEEASRSTREMAIDYVKTQEEALDENPLPLDRRKQVLNYFDIIRRHLDKK